MTQPSAPPIASATLTGPQISGRQPDTFDFLALPPELRNMIYSFISSNISSHIIRQSGDPSLTKRRPRRFRTGRRSPLYLDKLQMPYLSLKQTCQLIRHEFHQIYFSQHAVALCDFEIYFETFIQQPRGSWRRTIDLWHEGLRTFELVVTPWATHGTYLDILQVLRLKTRHPACEIKVRRADLGYEGAIAPLQHLINNTNEKWGGWIRTGAMQAVDVAPHALIPPIALRLEVVIVLSQKGAEKWEGISARPRGAGPVYTIAEKYVREVGLDVQGLRVSYRLLRSREESKGRGVR